MSWSAYLEDDRGHTEGLWNYTHNCNGMANAVIPEFLTNEKNSWWRLLDGTAGPDGARFLNIIITRMTDEREVLRLKNPENGWGDYDSFLEVLTQMRDCVPEWPTVWSVNG